MLHSLFACNVGKHIHFHFLHSDSLPSDSLVKLNRLCERFGAKFLPLEVDAALLDGFPLSERFPVEAWYRVVLPTLLFNVDRVLWLDADTLVRGDIEPLWSTNLGGAPLAACPNPILYGFQSLIARLGVRDRSLYFNSGVMLMNLKRMRDEGYRSTLLALGREHFQYIRFADQDVLNAAYAHRYLKLHMRWNVLTHAYINIPETRRVFGKSAMESALREPQILHFTGSPRHKPWAYSCGHPFQDLYLQHRAAAGWPLEAINRRVSWRSRVVKYVPLRWRFVLNALRSGNVKESLSYLRQW